MQQNKVVRSTAFTEITRTLQILPKLYVNLAKKIALEVIFNRSCEGYPNSAIKTYYEIHHQRLCTSGAIMPE